MLGDSLALALLWKLKNDKVLKKLKDRKRRDWKRKKVIIFFCVERIDNVTHKVKVQVKEKQRIV
jgi:hypothetical protein